MNILQVSELKTYFYSAETVVKAVDGVSFDIETGGVFGLVGESGSGKTLTALSILKLVSEPGRIVDGSAIFNGTDLLKLDERSLRAVRGSKISFVFQEPASSFNPVFTIGEQAVEAITAHRNVAGSIAKDIAMTYLKRAHVREADRIFHAYPHQLSGGTKQRAMIAMALVNAPELIILDEPTTALDVTIQSQILELIREIIRDEKLSALFISHDFGIIAAMCDHIAVMRKGKIVEMGETKQVLRDPKDKYTISLLESVKALEC